jgi:hypothetical protein
MSVASALNVPLRTQLVGENYLQTFDQKFQVWRDDAAQSYTYATSPLHQYRARIQSDFLEGNAPLVDVWA